MGIFDEFGSYDPGLDEDFLRGLWMKANKAYLAYDPAHFSATFEPAGGSKRESTPPTRAMGYPPYHQKLIPRTGFIDGGMILTKGLIVTRNEYEEAEAEEWNAFADAIDKLANIEVDHLNATETFEDGTILWIYDKIPTITTMEA